MSQDEHKHVVSYKTYTIILINLLILTAISVAVTEIELGPLTVFMAVFLASVKSALVLIYFMHLKFDNAMYKIMVGLVLVVFVIVMVITFLDYNFR
ncbi:MAG: cytochrome-c oxidase [Bacteroidetes bacterium]|jgi:cytochrome c oxidase subunit 4|nr:cytochrome-c oxidase [Bacteroidota bacterium]